MTSYHVAMFYHGFSVIGIAFYFSGVFLKSDHIPPPNRVKRKIIEYQDETELAPKYCKRQITSAKRKTCKSQVTNVLTLQDASVHGKAMPILLTLTNFVSLLFSFFLSTASDMFLCPFFSNFHDNVMFFCLR